MTAKANTIDSILERVIEDENGCWIWQGRVDADGVPQVKWHGRNASVGRILAREYLGNIPARLTRTCDTPQCVSPRHVLTAEIDPSWMPSADSDQESDLFESLGFHVLEYSWTLDAQDEDYRETTAWLKGHDPDGRWF